MKDLKDLTPQIQKNLSQKGQAVPAAHSWKKVPAIPSLPVHKPAPKKDLTKTSHVSKEWQPAAQTAACSCHLESKTSEASLEPERFKRWKNAASVLRNIDRSKATELPDNISVVKSSEQEKTRHEEDKQDELWRDMMKNQEERQFRIGRITNFFS
jgi:hypothetical protein